MQHVLTNLPRVLLVLSTFMLVVVVTGCATSGPFAAAPVPTTQTVRVIEGIPYATGDVLTQEGQEGTKVLTMDVYMPAQPDSQPWPSLLLIHGGGFSDGDPKQMEQLAYFFVERGFVCFANSYRLRRDRPDATPEAALADTMAAVRWVRRHASEYGGRPDAIGALGYSAGAFASVAVAAADPGDFRPDGDGIAPFNTPGESPALQAAVVVAGGLLDPAKLDAGDPPLLVIHGTRDQVVPMARGQQICETAQAVGVHCEFIPIERADHWPLNGNYEGRNVKEYVADFLHRYLDVPHVPMAAPEVAAPVSQQADVTVMPEGAPKPGAPMVSLDTSATLHGAVALDPPGGRYAAGTLVKLTPVPQDGYAFAYWAGDIRETGETAYVVVDRDKKIEAGFVPRADAERVALETEVVGPGTLVVKPPLERYVKGDAVALEAIASRGARFVRWQGVENDNAVASVVMDDDRQVAAVFETVVAVAPDVVRLSSDGGTARLRIKGSGEWHMTPLWDVPGLEVESSRNRIALECAPNNTAYARTGLLRFTSPELGERYVQVPVVQEAAPGADTRLAWWEQATQPSPARVLMVNTEGTFTLATTQGTAIGYVAENGQPLTIPAGADYDIYAEWDLPSNPELLSDPEFPTDTRTSYCYVGIDSGQINASQLRFGVEWKNIGGGDEWVLRGQYETQQLSLKAQHGGSVPRHIGVRVWKRYEGEPQTAVVRAAYRLDAGPWQGYSFTTPGHSEAYPLGLRGEDRDTDFVTFKVRGLASLRFAEPVIEMP